jgi:hypothetical protein
MHFTKDFVRARTPCAEGFRWYLRHRRDESGCRQVPDPLARTGPLSKGPALVTGGLLVGLEASGSLCVRQGLLREAQCLVHGQERWEARDAD